MRRCILLVLALAVAALIPAPAEALPSPKDAWIELRTANFTFYSDAGEPRTREIGEALERLRDALAQLSPELRLNSPVPTYIFIFKNATSIRPFQHTYNGQPLDSGGYFLSRELGNYLAINSDLDGDDRAIIYHEYVHYVLRTNTAGLPLWLNEGLSEYYSTFKVGKDEVQIGLPVRRYMLWLRRHNFIPLATLFKVDEHSPAYNDPSRRADFYAESWILVHYLISGNPERRRQAAEYLRLAQTDASPERLFAQAFGTDPAALENELRTYIQLHLFDPTRLPIRPEANLAMEARPLTWPDVLYRLGDLHANLPEDHRAAAAEHFRAALAAQPDHALALAGLGHLEEVAERPAAARPYYEKAAKLAPDDFLVQFLYGRNLIAEPDADSLRQARAALSRAVALHPDFGEAWASLGYTYQSAEELPAEAVRALETAHRLLPSRMDVAHNLALAYARTGQTGKAEELIADVLLPNAKPAEVESVREALIDEEQRRAEELIEREKFEEALPILDRVQTKTARPERRASVARRIEEIRNAINFNAFVDGYNQAVELANRGDAKGAVALLEPLLATTRNPAQVEQARTLIDRLKPPQKKRTGRS